MPQPEWSDGQIRAVGMDPAKVHHAMLVQRERDERPLNRFRLGYIGWLLTNATFLTEHDQLLSDHSNAVRQYGTSDAGSLAPQAEGAFIPNDSAIQFGPHLTLRRRRFCCGGGSVVSLGPTCPIR